jgi:hypothetical protein
MDEKIEEIAKKHDNRNTHKKLKINREPWILIEMLQILSRLKTLYSNKKKDHSIA